MNRRRRNPLKASPLRRASPAPGRAVPPICRLLAVGCILLSGFAAFAPAAGAATPHVLRNPTGIDGHAPAVLAASTGGISLESAATKAGETGRNVAMSLIGLALAVAAIV